jgi:predicted nucleic acid-binding protein
MLAGAFPFVLSEALLAEYRTVLVRPKLRRLHGLTVAEVETILTDLAQHAIVLNPQPRAAPAAPDPGDQLLWDLLAVRADLLLVTGDRRLLQDSGMRGRVIAPQAFVAGI